MTLDRSIYIVLCGHPKGPYFSETDYWRTDLVNVCKDIISGQYGQEILAVLEVNPTTKLCRDATHEFKAILDRSTCDD